MQVPEVQGSPREAGSQAGRQLLATYRLHVGKPDGGPRYQVRLALTSCRDDAHVAKIGASDDPSQCDKA